MSIFTAAVGLDHDKPLENTLNQELRAMAEGEAGALVGGATHSELAGNIAGDLVQQVDGNGSPASLAVDMSQVQAAIMASPEIKALEATVDGLEASMRMAGLPVFMPEAPAVSPNALTPAQVEAYKDVTYSDLAKTGPVVPHASSVPAPGTDGK